MLLFVDNLTNSDFSYLHPQRGLVGETWLSRIELEGELDEQGMVCDFGIVKSTTRQLLDDLIDHRLLVPAEAANLRVSHIGTELCSELSTELGTELYSELGTELSTELPTGLPTGQGESGTHLHWRLADGQAIEHASPIQCITLIDADAITPTTVARWCEAQLRQRLPDSIQHIRVSFTPEAIDGPFYHYSHGLKKHRGKCQRIAHGHRSKIQIERNGAPAPDLESQWATTLRDTFIGTREDLHPDADTPPGYYRFAYQAPEGHFSLQLPQRACYLLDSDSTVEHIARHIAETLKQHEPAHTFTVKAYEGLGKGAIASRL